MKYYLLLYYLIISLGIIKAENNTQEITNDENNIQEIICNNAEQYIGSDLWEYPCNNSIWNFLIAKGKERLSFNEKVFYCSDEPKCNLFVYEMLDKSGITINLPNEMSNKCALLKTFSSNPKERPPTASQWYNGEVENMKLIGIGEEGLSNAIRGDILTNGHHMGIISGKKKTISARCDVIVENEYGWDDNSTKIFRYEGGPLDNLVSDESSENLIMDNLGAQYYTSKIVISSIILSLLF